MTGNFEIKSVKENQFWLVGPNKTILKEGNIIHVIISGLQDYNMAHSQFKLHQQITGLVNDKVSYLVDLNDSGKSTPEARRIWKDISGRDDTFKVAFFGSHPVAKVLADFIIDIAKNNNMRFFEQEGEAVRWLKGKI